MKRPLSRILVIGCGSAGERHIKNLQSLGVAEICACEQDRQRLKHISDEYKIQTFEDYEEVFSNEAIDAALVCTPTSEHIVPALAAIRQGCHVFVEKPLSHTLEGVDNLIEEASRKNLILMTGFNFRFHPNLQQIKTLLDREEIGRPISARAHFGSYFLYRVPYHGGRDYKQDYAAKKVGGGVILDAATHQIDYMSWFLGKVKEVFCYSGRMSSLELEAEDIAEILLKFETGAIASLHVDFVQKPYQIQCEIIGEKGTLAWDFRTNTVRLSCETDNKWQTFTENNFDHDETYVREITHFIECIRGKEEPPVDGIRGKKLLQIALAAKESTQTGKLIAL
jgi:predicted dehydrogenase